MNPSHLTRKIFAWVSMYTSTHRLESRVGSTFIIWAWKCSLVYHMCPSKLMCLCLSTHSRIKNVKLQSNELRPEILNGKSKTEMVGHSGVVVCILKFGPWSSCKGVLLVALTNFYSPTWLYHMYCMVMLLISFPQCKIILDLFLVFVFWIPEMLA